MLYIFSGLPGTGKTSLSKALSVKLQAVYLRIDTIEQALKDNDFTNLYDQGYKIAFNLAY
jgi:predicted kinase